ncbi:MAG: anthranilate synthase component I family protein, partial [Candidatus Peribacteraceae bacterium]
MHFPLTSTVLRPRHFDPLFLLRELGFRRSYCALLESASRTTGNDFSFIALGARDKMTIRNSRVSGSQYVPSGTVTDPLAVFSGLIGTGKERRRLRMGYIGFLSYEAARYFEDIELKPDRSIPDAEFILPEVLLRIDHRKREVTVTAHGGTNENLTSIEKIIMSSPPHGDSLIFPAAGTPRPGGSPRIRGASATQRRSCGKIQHLPVMTQKDIAPFRQTTSEEFCRDVETIKKGILAGETFQVVLSQELMLKADVSPEMVYDRLREINPSPYMYYFRTPDRTIVGASPETLVRVDGRRILYRPIAGTRKRTGKKEEDDRMRAELLSDEKERCEHQMLVDLGRNDVGRVAAIGSIKLRNPFRIETCAHVYHIVSDIVARVRPGLNSLDVLRAVFPAGTLTGAP